MSQWEQSSNRSEPLVPEKKVLAAIPCFNTERTIGEVVRIARKHVDLVVVINDGSTDNTAKVAESAGAVLVNHPSRQGYAATVKTSFKSAQENHACVLVTLDGDAQHNPCEIKRVIAPILNGSADMVIGSRFLPCKEDTVSGDYTTLLEKIESLEPRRMPAYRKFGILLITWLFNVGAKKKLTDAQSGFRAFSRQALDVCYPEGKGVGVSVEVLIKARQGGLAIREVPITCLYHKASSTRNPFIHGMDVILATIGLRLREMSGRRDKP